MCEEGNALYGLSEAHFIGQNAINALIIEVGQPVHSLQLVRLQLPFEDGRLKNVLVRDQHRCSKTEIPVNCDVEGKGKERDVHVYNY